MINSASQYPVHALFSTESNIVYRIPRYQREYSWQKKEWEDLFQDLVEAEGAHFLGTIITLNQTKDAVDSTVLELIDGQQRATTLTLLLSSIYSIFKEHRDELDDDAQFAMISLGKRLVLPGGHLRVTPQTQGKNLDDYRRVLTIAGLKIESVQLPYFPMRRIHKCFQYFRTAIAELAESEGTTAVEAAERVLHTAQQAILVKIEVASHADAFVLFESLNNRGMPLTPVDLIKNHLLAASSGDGLDVDDAFKMWNEMLSNLGDTYSTHERFLRHYYNAFKAELPEVLNAQVATKSKLIGIYEKLLSGDLRARMEALVTASGIYGRVTCVTELDEPTELDDALRKLMRAQGAPSYILLMWLLSKRDELKVSDDHLVAVVRRLTSFFVRRNLTGFPQTYGLPTLFMGIVGNVVGLTGDAVVARIVRDLVAVSSSDAEFRDRLEGPIYDENSDVTRFILVSLAEHAMTKETWRDLWVQEKGHYTFTIEHVLPQGKNLPQAWVDMLGGPDAATTVQEAHVHRLGNLTITAYNSTLGNKSFVDKRDRTDARGLHIGYRNGLALNTGLATKDSWTAADIDARTRELAAQVVSRFPLS
ncbi:DUF262 domain-containing protein [Pseudonocardia yuanmonensis]|uniref:DUF262 domain-containing protein n=1 Tax=Pseudonocardia yuanmonensis TaxID=1095914 RepID=A0ABP8W6J4_9PSEU